ncbi:ATR-interacting protein-like [Branchiostoma floridae]|uniref:ATR-interacting protein-like n=1 Tax=Branchiostoma floridae TaxID=7739 RepID=A0A9J7L6Y2_BRAFL|nr:ATR-interacting protein-like [Branchiostoma floridae]
MMASNPLFTGPKTGNHHRPGMFTYNTQQNRLPARHSNMAAPSDQDSVETPRKKARLDNAATGSGFNDTFADDDEFLTADDLDQIDFMASQAYSQADPSETAPAEPRQQKQNGCNMGQASTSATRNLVQSNVPNFDSLTSFSQVTNNSSLGSRQLQTKRQTQGSTSGVSSAGSFTFKSASGRTTHVSNSNVLPKGGDGGSSTKVMAQNSRELENKRGGGMTFRQKGEVQVSSAASVTTGSNLSKAGPSSTRQTGPDINQQELNRLKAECDNYKKQLASLQEEQFGKEGEIKILRGSLKKHQEEIDQFKKARLEEEEKKVQAQTSKEKELEKELERLKTQLQFKEAEVTEAQNVVKVMEQKCKRLAEGGNSSTTPVNSPKVGGIPAKFKSEPKSPRTPGRGNFPTKESFMEEGKTKKSPGQVKGEGSGATNTPEKNVSPARKSESPGVKSRLQNSPEKTSSEAAQVPQTERPLSLGLGIVTDGFSGPLLMQKLLLPGNLPASYGKKESHDAQQGLLTLFQLQCQVDQPASGSKDHGHLGNAQGSSTGPVPTSSVSSSASSTTTLNPEHHKLALHGISHLLSPARRKEDNKQHVVHRDAKSLSDLLKCPPQTTESVVSLFPMIEDHLSQYRDVIQTKINQSLVTSMDSSSKGGSFEGGSIDSSNCSSNVSESVVNFRQAKEGAANALRLLERLLRYCPEAGNVLMQGWVSSQSQEVAVTMHEKIQSGQQDEDVMIVEEGTSIPSLEKKMDTSTGNTSTIVMASSSPEQTTRSPSFQTHPWLSTCQLFGDLLKLFDLQVNHKVHSAPVVTMATLEVLTALASSCDKKDLDNFKPLFSDSLLPSCLTEDCDVMIVTLCAQLLVSLTPCTALVSSFCTQTESCPLLNMYYHGERQGGATVQQWVAMQQQVVRLLSTVVSTHPGGTTLLVKSDCQCSMEVVRSLVIMLYRAVSEVLEGRDTSSAREHLQLLRSGTLVLHHLSLHDPLYGEHHAAVEHQYTRLVHGLKRVFSKLTDVRENEEIAVHDLWELDHQILDDSGGSQDDQMEVDP